MGFWFAVPLVALAGKLIYDAVTDDDSSSSSTHDSALSKAKSKRTKKRRKTIAKVVKSYRERSIEDLSLEISNIEGVTLISEENKVKVCFDEIDKEVSFLRNIKRLLDSEYDFCEKSLGESEDKIFVGLSQARDFSGSFADLFGQSSVETVLFRDTKEVEDVMLEKALIDYGGHAGINAYDEYVKEEDPFIEVLKRAAAKEGGY